MDRTVAQNFGLTVACLAGSIGLTAIAYAVSRDGGDIAVWVSALVALFLAWRLGSGIPADRSILALFVGIGLAAVWWSSMYVFAAWYRFDVLRNADVVSWGNYARLHNTIGIGVHVACAVSALCGSLSRQK